MTRAQALAKLIAKVEAGDDFLFGGGMGDMCGISDGNWTLCYYAFHGSLDAALALHKAVLPGAGATVEYWGKVCHAKVEPHNIDPIWANNMQCPARAWLLAILKALHAQEQETTQ